MSQLKLKAFVLSLNVHWQNYNANEIIAYENSIRKVNNGQKLLGVKAGYQIEFFVNILDSRLFHCITTL